MPAKDNVSKDQFHMHLYHGTSTAHLESIKKQGLGTHGVYLTHDPGLAEYYADTAADQDGGKPVIVTARSNPRNLLVDSNAFEDPVKATDFGAQPRKFDSSKLRDYDKDWKNSLRQAGSVYHRGIIPPENIIDIEKL